MMNKMMKKVAIAIAAAAMAITSISTVAMADQTTVSSMALNYDVYPESGTYYVNNDIGLNVRTLPSKAAASLGGLCRGDQVTVTGRVYENGSADGWVRINFNGQTGYVRNCLSTERPAMNNQTNEGYGYASGITADGQIQTNNAGTPDYVKTAANEATKEQYTVNVDGYLALRSDPAFNYGNEVGQLHTGDVVNFKQSYGTYWCVYVPATGMLGFVNSNYLV